MCVKPIRARRALSFLQPVLLDRGELDHPTWFETPREFFRLSHPHGVMLVKG